MIQDYSINIIEYGAAGDGVCDDAEVIQSAIDELAKRGGGKIFFPYTPHGYRIARAADEKSRAQLVIPPGCHNIVLAGEMPCRVLNDYMIRPPIPQLGLNEPTSFAIKNDNVFLFSDWDAPEEHDPVQRPWSLLGCCEGTSLKGKFSVPHFSMCDLEFRVKLPADRMYPVMSAANLQNIARINIQDCQFCLDRNVGDFESGYELQANPCHTAGLIASGDQNDNNVLRNVAVQGFRYGFVFGEHVIADYLYVHNCEQAIIFHDSSHLSSIYHVVAQHNQKILCSTENVLFGMLPGPCFVEIGTVDFEPGDPSRHRPSVSNMTYGIWDPGNRLYGNLKYHMGCPVAKDWFPKEGGENFRCHNFIDA